MTERGHVGDDRREAVLRIRKVGAQGLQPVRITPDEDHSRTERRQRLRRGARRGRRWRR